VKLAVLPARVAVRRQVGEQRVIEIAAAEVGVELLCIDAAQDRAMATRDEMACQRHGGFAPQRIHAAPAQALQQRLAIRTHVGEEQIAERNVGDRRYAFARLRQCVRERRLVLCVGRLRWNRRLDQGQ